MGDTDQQHWAHCLTLPEAIARFPPSWTPEVVQETLWKRLQVGKFHAAAEQIIHPDGAIQNFVGIAPDRWNHNQPGRNSAFWITGDIDFVHELPNDRYDELYDAWSPGKTETTRLIGVRIDPASIHFQERQEEEAAQPISRRGRRPAAWWPAFAEELAVHIHEQGVPSGAGADGQGEMIEAILQRLSDRGIEATRTTIQPVIQAVLDRLRAAGN